MDYHKDSSPQEPPRNTRSSYDSSFDRRSGGYSSTRERMLSQDFKTPTQSSTVAQAAPTPRVEPVKKQWVDPNKDIAKKYPLKNVEYQQIYDMVKSQLTPTGGLSYIKQFNSILVLDKPAAHEKVKVILDAVVRDAVNIRIDVEFAGMKSYDDYGISVKHNGINIRNGKIDWPDKARVDIRGASGNQQTNTKQMLTTMSGHAANLWVTKTAVDRQLFDQYKFIPFYGRHGGRAVLINPPQLRDVGASLYILPTYGDDGMVTVELFPVLTTEVGGKQQSFRVEKVSTKVTGRPGQRLFLGGMDKSTKGFFTSIFNPVGVRKQNVTDLVNIYVTPYVMKRGNRR